MQVWSIYIKEYMPFVMSSILGQENTNLFYMVSSMAFNNFTECFPNRSKHIFALLDESREGDNHFTWAGSIWVHSLLLETISENSVREERCSPLMSSEVKLHSGMLTRTYSFPWVLKNLFLSFNRGEHKSSLCNTSYRLTELEHALWFMI